MVARNNQKVYEKSIVISGYPKSGNTWVTRLTAELVGCPVKGFWNEKENKEIAIEGLDRMSEYNCYKSHHQRFELESINPIPDKVIYVIRDPRDIVFSGINYFKRRINLIGIWPQFILVKLINRLWQKSHFGKLRLKSEMIKAVLYGNKQIHFWCRVSWKEHVTPFLDSEALIVQYEDILQNPYEEAVRILKYIELEKSEKEIHKAITLQSFSNKKEEFKKNGKKYQMKFIRKGGRQYWKNKLNDEEKALFEENLEIELKKLNYIN